MPKTIDITSQRFGRFVVIERALPNGSDRHARWRCQCDCGQQRIVSGHTLRLGTSRSCGCLGVENSRAVVMTHGHSIGHQLSPTYRSWRNMQTRCQNPNSSRYADYGGRGIKISKRWLGPSGFQHFLADMGERPFGKEIDRMDNDGDYKPGNCRWATKLEHGKNRRKRRKH